MATSSWRSSLANIEAKLRRSLQLAGPINLRLEEPAPLVPVMIAEDLTRPGSAGSDFRGRRFAATHVTGTIAAAAFGNLELSCAALTTLRGNEDKGGLIIDSLELQWLGAVLTQKITTELRMSVTFAVHPDAVLPGGFMVDPIGRFNGTNPGTAELAPVEIGSSTTVAAGGFGNRIWEGILTSDGTPRVVPVECFIRDSSYLVVGNSAALASAASLMATWRGRVF